MPGPTTPTSISGTPLSRRWRTRLVLTRSHLRLWLLVVVLATVFYTALADRGIFTLAIVLGPNDLDPHPPRDRRLHAGDELIVSASVDTLRAFLGN